VIGRQRLPTRGQTGPDSKQITKIEQYFEHELVALVPGVEFFHAPRLAIRLGALVLLTVGGFEVGEDLVAGAHEDQKTVRSEK
jgi:hypothetical protein